MLSANSPIFDRLYRDVVERGGIHAIGTKQVGKSNLKKALTAYSIQEHPETKTIIIDPEGSWEYTFDKVQFYRILPKSVRISEEIVGQRLNGTNFTRKAYRLDRTTRNDCLKLLKSKEPVLFVVELDNPEEIGYFSAWLIETVYDMQRIKRKYWKGQLKQSYFIVLEESENIFDQSSLDKTIFNKLRKKYAEMANLRIGILSSSQRLTEVNKKFRAKMCGYLIGHILPEDFIGILQRALKLHMGAEAKTVTEPSFRYSFYYTGSGETFRPQKFKASGKPYEIPRSKTNMTENTTESQKGHKKRSKLLDRLKKFWNRHKDGIKFWIWKYDLPEAPRNLKEATKTDGFNEEDETEEDTAFGVPIDMLEENED